MRVYDLAIKLLNSEIEDYDIYPTSTNTSLHITISNRSMIKKTISGNIDQNELFTIQKLIQNKKDKKEYIEFESFLNEIINRLEGVK